MLMIKECSKNIDKIEFKQSNKKPSKMITSINLDTPNKSQVAKICLFDLSKDQNEQPLRLEKDTEC